MSFLPVGDYGVIGDLPTGQLVARNGPSDRWGAPATDAEDDVATLSSAPDVAWQIEPARATARLSLAMDEAAWFVLRCDDDEVYAVAHYRSQEKLDATARWWDEWSSRLQYQGPYRQEVERSALALKLCCYEPSGAISAPPRTRLPEPPGWARGRNGHYRYLGFRGAALR